MAADARRALTGRSGRPRPAHAGDGGTPPGRGTDGAWPAPHTGPAAGSAPAGEAAVPHARETAWSPPAAPSGDTDETAARPAPESVVLADTAAQHDVRRPLIAHGCWYPSVDPSGRHVAVICDRTGVPQLWTGPVDGDEVRLLDAEPDPVTEVSWSPDGRWIAYTTAPGGGELTRVLCVRPDGTGRRLLAGGEPGTSAHLGCWTHDGSALAVTVREPGPVGPDRAGLAAGTAPAGPPVPVHPGDWAHRDGHAVLLGGAPLTVPVGPQSERAGVHPGRPLGTRTLTAYLVDPDGASAPVLLVSEPGAASLRVCALSRSGRFALVRRGPRGGREALIVRRTDRAVTCAVRAADGDPWIGGFSPDERTLWLRSDSGREFAALLAVSLGPRGQWRGQRVAAARDDCDLELLVLHHDARSALLAWNVRGVSDLEVTALPPAGSAERATYRAGGATTQAAGGARSLATEGATAEPDAPLTGPALPHEVITRMAPGSDPDSPVLALSGSRRRPGVWWLPHGLPLRTPWSSSDEDAIPGGPGGHPPVRPFPLRPVARDGLRLGGWYYRAPGRSAHEPAPCVLHLHGGPEEQERPVLQTLYHELLGRGLDIFAPDVRGSSGYGRSFVDADLGTGRFAAIEDVADCAAHVILAGLADPGRLAVMGRSYGGYLTMASLVWHPELFRTGVAVCGMSDLLTFFAGTEPWIAESAVHKYGHPERDRDLLRALSPMSRIDELRVPVLAVHGEHDTNVPVGESQQFVRAARERGLEAELLLLRQEGHDFRRADNRRLFRRTAADWMQRHLLGQEAIHWAEQRR
ncbi:S9 family peptidase [Streptomyces mexicanus]|uniref:S9 family peptidase n=1 Tax=Streptomyces mexicanus TaxID=178566 RepID=UPI003683A5AF